MIELSGIGSFEFKGLDLGESEDIIFPHLKVSMPNYVSARKVDADWINRIILNGVAYFRICDDLWNAFITFLTANNGRLITYKRYTLADELVEQREGLLEIKDVSEGRNIYTVSFKMEVDI